MTPRLLRARAAPERGATLLELLVALAVSTVVVLVGALLLAELARGQHRHGARASSIGSTTDVALELIERDARRAVGFPRRLGDHRAARSLVLRLPEGEAVVYAAEDDRLWRIVVGADGVETRRALLDGLLVAELASSPRGTVAVTLRRRDEPPRQRVVVARNRLPVDPP